MLRDGSLPAWARSDDFGEELRQMTNEASTLSQEQEKLSHTRQPVSKLLAASHLGPFAAELLHHGSFPATSRSDDFREELQQITNEASQLAHEKLEINYQSGKQQVRGHMEAIMIQHMQHCSTIQDMIRQCDAKTASLESTKNSMRNTVDLLEAAMLDLRLRGNAPCGAGAMPSPPQLPVSAPTKGFTTDGIFPRAGTSCVKNRHQMTTARQLLECSPMTNEKNRPPYHLLELGRRTPTLI